MALGKAKKKKAKGESKLAASETKRAAAAAGKAARDLGEAVVDQARTSDLDERAQKAMKRAKKSDAYVKGAQLAEKAKERLDQAGLDERANELARQARDSELARQVRESETTQQARKGLQRFSDEQLERLGEWLTDSKAGKKLGVKPKRRWPTAAAVVIGVGAGWAIGLLTAPKRGDEIRKELAEQSSSWREDLSKAADRIGPEGKSLISVSGDDLADKVRSKLGEDPRTAELPKLNVNVAEGTVFVRGTLPSGYEEDTVRSVVSSVPGVQDVDLQLTSET